jgi:hypothetical protein
VIQGQDRLSRKQGEQSCFGKRMRGSIVSFTQVAPQEGRCGASGATGTAWVGTPHHVQLTLAHLMLVYQPRHLLARTNMSKHISCCRYKKTEIIIYTTSQPILPQICPLPSRILSIGFLKLNLHVVKVQAPVIIPTPSAHVHAHIHIHAHTAHTAHITEIQIWQVAQIRTRTCISITHANA